MEDPHPRLLVTVRPRDDLREGLNRLLPGVPWAFLDDAPPSHREEVEAMLVGSFSRDSGRIDPATTPKLRFVQRLYTGLDGFPFERFPERVEVAGNVGAFAPFVAEHALALALAAARDLSGARERVSAGRLRPIPDQRSLYGATAVILGFGEIGRAIAQRLAGFEAQVIGLNRTGAPAPGCEEMVAADRLKEVLARGDFLFEARPLTTRTERTIGAAEFAAMRPDAVFVNIGRAGTVDEEALFRHLETHPRFRAAFDVWWSEEYAGGTFSTRFPFARLPNFVGTPHSAGYASGAEARALRLAVENLGRLFRGEAPQHVVDRREYAAESGSAPDPRRNGTPARDPSTASAPVRPSPP